MGIDSNALKCLLLGKFQEKIDFSHVAMIGRQSLFCSRYKLKKILSLCFPDITSSLVSDMLNECQGYAEPLFNFLGSKICHSFDISNYEGATDIWDMNLPLPEKYIRGGVYTLVYDGGAMEHIFNCPIVLMNEMRMVKIGGHLIIDVPTNNHSGHGFYQFSPELFFSTLIPENGFIIKNLFYNESNGSIKKVMSPIELKRRVEINTRYPALLFIIAQKISEVPDKLIIQQSDYINEWSGIGKKQKEKFSKIPTVLKEIIPEKIKTPIRRYVSRPPFSVSLKINIDKELKRYKLIANTNYTQV